MTKIEVQKFQNKEDEKLSSSVISWSPQPYQKIKSELKPNHGLAMDLNRFTLAWKPTRATNPLNSIYACLHGNYISMTFFTKYQSPSLKSKHFGDFGS
jgi:hypothetical protein